MEEKQPHNEDSAEGQGQCDTEMVDPPGLSEAVGCTCVPRCSLFGGSGSSTTRVAPTGTSDVEVAGCAQRQQRSSSSKGTLKSARSTSHPKDQVLASQLSEPPKRGHVGNSAANRHAARVAPTPQPQTFRNDSATAPGLDAKSHVLAAHLPVEAINQTQSPLLS